MLSRLRRVTSIRIMRGSQHVCSSWVRRILLRTLRSHANFPLEFDDTGCRRGQPPKYMPKGARSGDCMWAERPITYL